MNPFPINNYIEPRYFCDRENETKTLLSNISNNSNTAFFAQRRLGKTALIRHVFYLLQKKKAETIYIDIYATQNLKELTNQMANAIYNIFPENKSLVKKFLEAIKLLRPVISIDESTGGPELSLDISQPRQFEKTIPQLLQFLDNHHKQVVIAIDEFQQILSYPEKNVEAILRTSIQQLRNVCFVFCGSNQKMMHAIFNNAKRPFYASTKNINLQKINRKVYADFIRSKFSDHKIKITDAALDMILEISLGHTYYTQRICHDVFATDKKNITPQIVQNVLNTIIKDNEGVYFQYRNLLTTAQWQLLKAIAQEESVEQPYAGKFISQYDLVTPAAVKRSLEALIEKEMVFQNNSVEQTYCEVNDKFLMRWLQRLP